MQYTERQIAQLIKTHILTPKPMSPDIQQYVNDIYKLAGNVAPKVVVCTSPLDLVNKAEGQVQYLVRKQVWDQVWKQVRDQVRDQVWGQVWYLVRGQVWGQVWDQVRNQVQGQVWDQVWNQVRDQVRDQALLICAHLLDNKTLIGHPLMQFVSEVDWVFPTDKELFVVGKPVGYRVDAVVYPDVEYKVEGSVLIREMVVEELGREVLR